MKKNLLFYKIFFVFITILFLGISFVSYYGYVKAEESYVNSAYDHNLQRTSEIKTRMIKELEPASDDIMFLTNSYSLQRYHIWKNMHERKKEKKYKQIFSGSLLDFLKTQKKYFKFSVIDLDGQEVISAKYDNGNNRSFMLPEHLLQNKNSRPYFNAAKKLKKGDFYISDIDLNVENGEVQAPYVPVLRYATPIVDANNKIQAIFVASLYVESIFNIFKNMLQRDKENKTLYYLIDSQGNYIFSQNSSLMWNKQLKNGHNFFQERFNIEKYLLSKNSVVFQKGNKIYSIEKVYPSFRYSKKFYYIVSSQDISVALSQLNQFKLVFYAIILLVLIIGTVFTRYFAKIIVEPIEQVSTKLKSLSLGDMRERELLSYEHDALGEAMTDLIRYIKNIQKQSEAIIRGDFEYKIEIQSEYDHLGISLKKMNEILKRSKIKTDNDIWYSSGVGEFSEALADSSDLILVANKAIAKICNYVDAQSGVIYQYNKTTNFLQLLGRYASETSKEEIAMGEGLVGQVAKDKRSIRISNIDEHNYVIHSSGSNIKAQDIYLAPIVYEHNLFGVLEVATVGNFSEIEIVYINRVLEILANIFHNTMQRVKIKELLDASKKAYEELQVQSEELENSSRYKSEFLANMSHELRTPLNSIILLSKLLSQNKNSTLSDEDRAKSEVINKAGNDLLLLINDILDLSKVESGNLELQMAPTSSIEIFGELDGLFSEVAKDKGLELNFDDEFGSSFIADKTKLLQIIKNLLSNALKFTKKGSVSVVLYPQDEYLCFEVSDTGLGIAKDKLDLIFEAFKQVDGSISRNYGGTGLGLSISKSFVDLMGGEISVDSIEGRGSTFRVLIPLTLSYEAPQIEVVDPNQERYQESDKIFDPEALKDKNILIVDDDSRNIFTLSSLLQELGAETFSAMDGQEAIELLQKQKIDLILMDLMMPIMDGLKSIKIIKNDERFKHIPIIVLTAKTMQEDKDACFAAGADDYLPKPIDEDALVSMLKAWC